MSESYYGSAEEQQSQAERAKRRQESIADTYDDTSRERIEAVEKHEARGLAVTPHMNIMAGYAQQAKDAKEATK